MTKRTGKKSSFARYMKEVLDTYALGYLYDDEKKFFNLDNRGNLEAKTFSSHKKFVERWIRARIHEQQWWGKITQGGDMSSKKLRTYVTFKNTLCLEEYLLVDSDAKGRSYHTSLRTGTNSLEIEKGRHLGIDKKFRFCKKCESKQVEDEFHFVILCPLYKDLREKCFKSIFDVSGGKWDLKNRPAKEIFILLMSGTGDEYQKIIFRIFQCHLKRCFDLRNRE